MFTHSSRLIIFYFLTFLITTVILSYSNCLADEARDVLESKFFVKYSEESKFPDNVQSVWCKEEASDSDVLLLRECRKLSSVTIDNCSKLSSDSFVLLAGFSELEYLSLTGSNLNDGVARAISANEHITVLKLCGGQFTREGLSTFDRFHDLKKLTLCDAKINDGDFGFLSKLSKVEVLDVSNTNFGDEDNGVFIKMINCYQVNLAGTKISSKSTFIFGLCPNIKTLWLPEDRFSAEDKITIKSIVKRAVFVD